MYPLLRPRRRRAREIRLRAERRAGQLLSKMEKAKGGQPYQSGGTMGSPKTLRALGVAPDQSSRWQALAGVPDQDFEKAIGGEKKPSTSGIIGKPVRKMPATSLWLWGRLRDFERDGLLDMDGDQATELMTDAMLADDELQELAKDIKAMDAGTVRLGGVVSSGGFNFPAAGI